MTVALLKSWLHDGGRVAKPWVVLSAAISLSMLVAIYFVAVYLLKSQFTNDSYRPLFTTSGDFESVLRLMKANLMVLAIHVLACVAAWLVNVRLDCYLEERISAKEVNDKINEGLDFVSKRQALQRSLGRLTMAGVSALIIFSILRQIVYISGELNVASHTLHLSVLTLLARASLHGLFELTAIFLPLAALLLLGRRRQWDQLIAAAALSIILAIPMLLLAAVIETWVTGALFV